MPKRNTIYFVASLFLLSVYNGYGQDWTTPAVPYHPSYTPDKASKYFMRNDPLQPMLTFSIPRPPDSENVIMIPKEEIIKKINFDSLYLMECISVNGVNELYFCNELGGKYETEQPVIIHDSERGDIEIPDRYNIVIRVPFDIYEKYRKQMHEDDDLVLRIPKTEVSDLLTIYPIAARIKSITKDILDHLKDPPERLLNSIPGYIDYAVVFIAITDNTAWNEFACNEVQNEDLVINTDFTDAEYRNMIHDGELFVLKQLERMW
jgi:hypothetical protein